MLTLEIILQSIAFGFYVYMMAVIINWATDTKSYAGGAILSLGWTAIALVVLFFVYGKE